LRCGARGFDQRRAAAVAARPSHREGTATGGSESKNTAADGDFTKRNGDFTGKHMRNEATRMAICLPV